MPKQRLMLKPQRSDTRSKTSGKATGKATGKVSSKLSAKAAGKPNIKATSKPNIKATSKPNAKATDKPGVKAGAGKNKYDNILFALLDYQALPDPKNKPLFQEWVENVWDEVSGKFTIPLDPNKLADGNKINTLGSLIAAIFDESAIGVEYAGLDLNKAQDNQRGRLALVLQVKNVGAYKTRINEKKINTVKADFADVVKKLRIAAEKMRNS